MMKAIDLNDKLESLFRSERKITGEILKLIQVIDSKKSFLELGYPSLFEYLVKGIGYSEGAAQRRVSSARLLKACPRLETKVQEGTLHLSQMALAQVAIRQQEKVERKCFSSAQKEQILLKLESKNTWQTKKVLKEILPAFELKQTPVPLAAERVQITLNYSTDQWEKIKKLQDQMSHKVPSQKLEDLVLYFCEKELKDEAVNVVKGVSSKTVTENVSSGVKEQEVVEAKKGNPILKPPPPLRLTIPHKFGGFFAR